MRPRQYPQSKVIVVSDTGPLNYLILISCVEPLRDLSVSGRRFKSGRAFHGILSLGPH